MNRVVIHASNDGKVFKYHYYYGNLPDLQAVSKAISALSESRSDLYNSVELGSITVQHRLKTQGREAETYVIDDPLGDDDV